MESSEILTEAPPRVAVTAPPTPTWRESAGVLFKFLIHVVVGTSIFLVIYSPAIGIDVLVRWLETRGITDLLLTVLRVAEYALLAADTVLYVVFLVKTTYRMANEL